MNIPDEISKLIAALKGSFPGLSVNLDPPDISDGIWWIDLIVNSRHVAIAWSAENGFGMFTGDVGYGDRPNEACRSVPLAAERIGGIVDGLRNQHSAEHGPTPWGLH